MALRAKYTGATLVFYDDAVGIDTPVLTIDTANVVSLAALVGLSTAEIDVLDGVVPGTNAASKAVVLGPDSKIDSLDLTALKIGGVVKTNVVIGTAAGLKVARGTLTPDAQSKTVVTGLTTVVAAIAQLKGAPTINHSMVAADVGDQNGAPAAGSILIKSYKPASNADPTPATATANWVAVDWIAIGT